MGVLEGRVVLVTGAAGGIGRECALLAAREGAKVLVNDLGGAVAGGDGADRDPSQAEKTASEIRAAGGIAASNGGNIADIADVQRMVDQAKAELGGLDAVINSAGILRDRMLHKMTDSDWDDIIAVHLRGAYNISRTTIEGFRAQNSGSYVHFTSTSGLIGNLGQSNYAAAKMGVVGLSRILALEGQAKNVRSNTIAPFAWSRMIATIPITDEASERRVRRMKEGMRADQVAQLAIALAAPRCDVSGQIFAARGNEIVLFDQPRPVRTMARLEGWTPEAVLDHAMPAMKSAFLPLGPAATVFPYDPV